MEFREPRRGRKVSDFWTNVVTELRANPGKYACVGEFSAAVGSHIRNGTYPAFVPAGIEDKRTYMHRNYEVRTEKMPDKPRYEVFIRYIGDTE